MQSAAWIPAARLRQIAALLAVSGAAWAQTPGNLPTAIYPYPVSGASIGQGWDTFNDQATAATCVEVDVVALEKSSFTSEVTHAISSLTIARAQSSSISAKYSGGGGSASGSVSQSRSTRVNSDQQNFLFTFESSNGSTFAVPAGTVKRGVVSVPEATLRAAAANPNFAEILLQDMGQQPQQVRAGYVALTPWAQNLLRQNADSFSRMCGQGFVAAIHRGARINLLLTQANASDQEKQQLAASMSASGYGASGKASYSQSSERIASTAKLGYRVFQEGGIPIQPVALAHTAGLLNFSSILPKPQDLIANPTAFRVVVIPYANVTTGTESLPTPLRLLTLDDYYIALTDLYTMVGDILIDSTAFDPATLKLYGGPKRLTALRDEIQGDLAFLEGVIAQCYQDRKACTMQDAVKKYTNEVDAEVARRNAAVAPAPPAGSRMPSFLSFLDSSKVQQALMEQTPINKRADVQEVQNQAALAEEAAGIEEFRREVARVRAITTGDTVDEAFFLRFYWYLTQIPLPKANFTVPDLKVPAGADAQNQIKAKIDTIKQSLAEATFKIRMDPWKRVFCDELKSDVLCVGDAPLRALIDRNTLEVAASDFTLVPAPPPKKRNRKCGWDYPGRCGPKW